MSMITALKIALVAILIAAVCIFINAFSEKISGWFGLETKSTLQTRLGVQKCNNDKLADANASVVIAADVAGKVAAVGNAGIGNHATHNSDIDKATNALLEKKQKEIDALKLALMKAKPGIVVETDEGAIAATSQVQISSIWKTFCANVESAVSCKPTQTKGVK